MDRGGEIRSYTRTRALCRHGQSDTEGAMLDNRIIPTLLILAVIGNVLVVLKKRFVYFLVHF